MHFVRSPLILEEEIKCVWGIWNINVLLDGVNEALWLLPVDRSLHLMGCGLSFASSPYVNQYSTTVNLFWLLTFELLPRHPTLINILPQSICFDCWPLSFFLGQCFPHPDLHTTLSQSHPTNLLTLLSYLLALR